jgi:hypothetical protein
MCCVGPVIFIIIIAGHFYNLRTFKNTLVAAEATKGFAPVKGKCHWKKNMRRHNRT